ncbi:MAG TPA: tRNA pseudouridine(38-40) synthase TruA [Candidatus Nanopelagicales bacterium]
MTTERRDEPAGGLAPASAGGLLRLRLGVAYDGSAFHGWARQPGLRTVQGELEGALRAVLHVPVAVPVRVAVAGRTDTGVHALGQVCHADVPAAAWDRHGGQALRRLGGLLPAEVRVTAVAPAAPGFDARWSARWRRYEYLVADEAAVQDPRTRGHVLWIPRGLDVAAMDAAAQPFLGEHDFAAFCRARPDASSVRTVLTIGWQRGGGGEPGEGGPAGKGSATGVARFGIRADAFCHAMVRSLVGAFLAVGEGRWPIERPYELLVAGHRDPAIPTAPAHGLTLVEVGYPPDGELAVQAARAKRWRGR